MTRRMRTSRTVIVDKIIVALVAHTRPMTSVRLPSFTRLPPPFWLLRPIGLAGVTDLSRLVPVDPYLALHYRIL